MKTKKIPYYLLIFLLTAGAATILGFLSFGGMYALWPILGLALAAFGLSVAYEGEIYFQNIKNALNKWFFKRDYLPRRLAKECLADMVAEARKEEDCPQFFRDYEAQLLLLAQFGHARLDRESKKQKKQIKKTLSDMEKWFARQLFAARQEEEDDRENDRLNYQRELQRWLNDHGREKSMDLLARRERQFLAAKLFAVVSGAFMALGTTYLLVGQFLAIPLLASIPFGLFPALIIPMAVVAGIGWGLLTYNAITDMICNDTLRKWYVKLRDNIKADFSHGFWKGLFSRSTFMAVVALTLTGLAVALTICTAGTWWTIAKNTRPLFGWMAHMPRFIMGILNPIATGLSALIWNVENTMETFEMIDEELSAKENFFKRSWRSIRNGWSALRERENNWQLVNPFRIILLLTFVPLRILLFIGHLASISVTADRVPGIPEIASAILNFISEFFEDVHYFSFLTESDSDHHDHHHHHHHHHDHVEMEHLCDGHDDSARISQLLDERLKSGHGHSHDNDLPTRLLRFLFVPLIGLSALWASMTSGRDENGKHRVSLSAAWKHHMGIQPEQSIQVDTTKGPAVSGAWRVEQAVYRVERFEQEHFGRVLFGRDAALDKKQSLSDFKTRLRSDNPINDEVFSQEAEKEVYATQRFFNKPTTRTQAFLAGLSRRIAPITPEGAHNSDVDSDYGF
ncbi:hypothetical protein [Legionella sp. CNM-4043-24]|uniref:hypothetical protein n=1 Tax=Legionella sp. CNM-4043-24 TaxID=3421646 RepID=UPI00403B01B3